MLPRFDDMGWKYFEIGNALDKEPELVALPFSRDFDNLKEDQKALFNSVIEARVASYVDFSKILNTLIRSIEHNWSSCIDQWQSDRVFALNLSQYSQLFDHVRLFLKDNDFYNSEKLVEVKLKPEYKSLNFVETLRKVLEIYKITDIIGDQQEGFLKNMQAYSKLFEELIGCLVCFAGSKEEELLLMRLAFIIKRGFREFSKLYQLNPNAIHDVSQKMKDNCNLIFGETRKEFL